MRAPISVRLSDGRLDRHITKHVKRVRFRKTAPGGHADASCEIDMRSDAFHDLGPADRLWFYNERTGATIFDGYTNNPGTRSGRDGEGFKLVALGGVSLLQDKADQFVYVDQQLTSWGVSSEPQKAGGTRQAGVFPAGSGTNEGDPAIFLQMNQGVTANTGEQISMGYKGFAGGSMTLGGFVGIYDAGTSDANWELAWFGFPWVPGDPGYAIPATTAQSGFFVLAGGPYLLAGRPELVFRLRRGGPTTTPTQDIAWAVFGNPYVLGHLVDRYGVLRSMPATAHVTGLATAYVLAHEVVEDLLGRAMPFCDPATAVIEQTAFQLDQLAYPSGAKPGAVLDDLALYEPDMLFEVLEANQDGRHRFNYRAWPTDIRYGIPASMPVERPGSDADLCNRVLVAWTDAKGNRRVTVVTSAVPELGTRVRDAEPVTLPEGRGSEAAALRIGEQVLAARAAAPKAARVRVDRPIMDRKLGRMVEPFEIEPGYLALDAATGDRLRVTEMEYDDDSYIADVQLGEPVLTVEQRIARLERAS